MKTRARILCLSFLELSSKAWALGILICALCLYANAQSGPAWLDPSWTYRAPVTVSNNGGSSLSQFQVQIVLGSSFDFAHANLNGSDVRLTDSDGTSLLPFWIQAWTPPQSSATIWVRVPNLPSTGTTLYLYYGNPVATSASSGDATFDFFDDFSYSSPDSVSVSSVIGKAISWITRAQDATSSGGVSYWYDVGFQAWNPSGYPEVTGYIIPTIYDIVNTTTDPTLAANLKSRAQQMANWELTGQGSNGCWQYIFDTGQIIEGFVRAYKETGTSSYLAAAQRAGNCLVNSQNSDGTWPTDFGGFPHAYHARVSRNLLLLWQATGNSSYYNAAFNNLNWVLTQQQSNGWFNNAGISSTSENSSPLTHTIAYTMEGLLDSGILLNNSTYVSAAKKAADALLGQQQPDGSLTGGNYFSDWTPAVTDQCLTGSAQTALVWLKLYRYTSNQGSPDSRYLNAAIKMNRYLVGIQGNSSILGIDGGLAGSDPIGGAYMSNKILSWATKFLVDDLNLELTFVPNDTVPTPAFDPNKWSFPAGQAAFSNTNGVLKANTLSSGRGPRALAMKSGANIVFSDGIVEYSVYANGGFGEMGLMYRGQNPETDNSYVFYPSIWNSSNDWRLYGLESGVETYIANGGSFTPRVWYPVKAAIGGTSHSFWINGARVFLPPSDATFSTGTLGLMPWGNAVGWVSNFRLRKYAATEPTTTVGPAQVSAPGVASLTLNPSSVAGGNSSTGTVNLNVTTGGVVALASSNTSIATVPPSVTVPAGSLSASFAVNTTVVTSATTVTISATFASTIKTGNLLVTLGVSSLTLSPTSVVGGNPSTATVTLTGPAPAGGAVVTLSSSNTSVASVPASVTVAQGATSATFTVTTAGVAVSSSVTLSASYGGSGRAATLGVAPASISSLTLNPTSVVGGNASTGTVTLNGAAPPAGAAVTLSSSNTAAATVPTTVTVSPNANQASFTVTTSIVISSTTSTISATYSGVTKTATVTVGPALWMNTAWAYRRLVTVSNSTGTTLANFQVLVVLNSSFTFTHAQSNGGDVRFTASDGVTLIPFWIQNWSSSSASIWVQVPSIPSSGTSIYLYYGNPAATTASNGNATFSFFDDFSYTSGGTPAIDPSKWSFPAGQTGFSNVGGMLQYNGPTAGFGPRALAMKGGTSVVFSDGIVEYSLQSNGGFDEMGLVYRGQNPETANSYVFYPSIWNSQNDWLLYARVSNTDVRLGVGGSFAPGVWYSVKAAIGGSSHTFSINGTQIFAATDSSFSSGTVGLFAWGSTVSWVANFRVRKYAATEPTTLVGAEQLAQ